MGNKECFYVGLLQWIKSIQSPCDCYIRAFCLCASIRIGCNLIVVLLLCKVQLMYSGTHWSNVAPHIPWLLLLIVSLVLWIMLFNEYVINSSRISVISISDSGPNWLILHISTTPLVVYYLLYSCRCPAGRRRLWRLACLFHQWWAEFQPHPHLFAWCVVTRQLHLRCMSLMLLVSMVSLMESYIGTKVLSITTVDDHYQLVSWCTEYRSVL